jgi:hypothetical protein
MAEDKSNQKFTNIGVSVKNRDVLADIRNELAAASPVPNPKVSMDDVVSVLIKEYREHYPAGEVK